MRRVGRPLRDASRTATTATRRTEAPISRISFRWWTVRGPVLSTSLPYLIFYPRLTLHGPPHGHPDSASSRRRACPYGCPCTTSTLITGPPCPSKDSDARTEEVPPRTPHRDRVRTAPGGGNRLRVVLERGHRACLLPADIGFLEAQGPVRAGRRQTGRQRHPADLRRHP